MSVGHLRHPAEATLTHTADHLPAAQSWADRHSQTWGLPVGHVQARLCTAVQSSPPAAPGRVVLADGATDRLLSSDVWLDDRRVFGMDDFS